MDRPAATDQSPAVSVIMSVYNGKGGKITIEYYSNDELNRLLEFFGVLENF